MTRIEPNPQRLRDLLAALAAPAVGGTPGGGVSRPAASAADGRVRDLFRRVCEERTLVVTVDDGGNMYARREGTDPTALPVVIGSHLDTVVPGGRFDGILGVAAALETIAALDDSEVRTRRPIIVVNWTGEEGARFPPAMLGSGLVAGQWDADYLHSRTDTDGRVLRDELEAIGYLGDAAHRLRAFFASLELHIEQGTQLEDADALVGIVPSIEQVRWHRVSVSGPGGHAGGPGPAGRHEAIVAAARMIVAARDIALEASDLKTTVGRIGAVPGSDNVQPHEVEFSLDARSAENTVLDDHMQHLRATFEAIAAEEGVGVEVTQTWAMPSDPFDDDICALFEHVASERGAPWRRTRGLIGHDSLHLATMGPTAMLFARTRAGLSHAEAEFAPWESVLACVGVFAETAHRLADAEALTRTRG